MRRGGLPIIWHPEQADYVLVGLPVDRPGDRAVIQGVSNNGSVIYHIDQEYFAWNQDTGLIPLHSLYDLEGNQSSEARQITLFAISADGQTIVGTSGGNVDLPRLPTVWRNGVAFALPTGGYSAGFASSISDDGRVIGGNLQDGNRGIPAVWVDGVLQQIAPPSGGIIRDYSNILAVHSGLGSDTHGWAAAASDEVIRSDGVVNEFWREDPNNFGVATNFTGTVRHFSADTDSLNLVTLQDSPTGLCAGFSCYISPPVAHVFSIPLNGSFNPSIQYDLSGDGEVSPQDVLIVINAINANPNKQLYELPELRMAVPKIDVNGDGELSPSDALTIINYLNDPAATLLQSATGEGESPTQSIDLSILALATDDLVSVGSQRRK